MRALKEVVLVALVQSTFWLVAQGRPLDNWKDSSGGNDTRQVAGIRISPESGFSQKHLLQLTSDLRKLTGISDLRFDENGKLSFDPNAPVESGSATARELLRKADRELSVVVENHSGSSQVAFADVKAVSRYGFVSRVERQGSFDTFQFDEIEGYSLRLDFGDLDLLTGHPGAIESFGIGLIFLHELSHGALKTKDGGIPRSILKLGEAAELINLVRKEMGLPLRTQYRPEVVRIGSLVLERMRFEGSDCTCFAVWPSRSVKQ